MIRILTIAAIAITAGTSASVWALDIGKLRKADDDMKISYEGRTIDHIEEMDVINEAGAKIGEIEDVLINEDNEIVAAVVDLKDTDRDVIVDLDDLEIGDPRSKNFVSKRTIVELTDLPEWRD